MDITKTLTSSETSAKANPKVRGWLNALSEADKREKDWRKDGSRLVTLYECGKAQEYQFNILYSNTETLAPALYNNLPRPVVQRRFKDEDPIGKVGSEVIQRSLEFLLDNDLGNYPSFDDMMQQSVLEALVPGRGVVRFKYDASFAEVAREEQAEATEGKVEETKVTEEVSYETVCGEVVPWNRFRHGYAKQWKDVPWVSFEHFMTKEELEKNFGELGLRVPLTISGQASENLSEEEGEDKKLDDAEGAKLGHVFEIWDKDERKVLFIAPALPETFLREVDDPLGLSGFFPMPKPLSFFGKIRSLVPVPLYLAYEEQAKELNRITVRINKIINALKVRGFYDSTLEGLEKVLQAEDNVLVPAENVAAMQQGQTLEKAIWLMPLEKLIAVLQQLYVQRQQVKQVIYEITGISDILRGASVASETATAQNIKNQWGTLRLKRMQKLVGKFVRDSLRVMAEIACTKLSPETLSQMTGLQYPTAEQKAQAQSILQQMQASLPPGTPPPPQAQELMTIAAKPSWQDITSMLSNDLQRTYHIDIETNSTVDAEATEDKQNIGEFLNAVAQFLNGVGPLVMQGVMPFEAAKSILLAVTRRYRFGTEVEEQIRAMQPPKPQGQDGAGEAAAKAKLELETSQQEAKLKQQEMLLDFNLKKMESEFKMQELQRKSELALAQHKAKMQQMALQAQQRAAQAAMPPKSAGVTAE